MSQKPSKLQERINYYLTIIVLALVVIVPPVSCGLFYLSQVPDITWGSADNLTFTRIWMYRERRPIGIAYQSQRVIKEYSPSEACAETRLRFLLWGESSKAQPSTSSRTVILVGDRWQPNGELCR